MFDCALEVLHARVDARVEAGTEEESDAAEQLYALPRYAMAETALAEGLLRLAATAEPIGEADTLGIQGLDEEQRAAVAAAMQHGVSLLTGGPGTGKSRTVASVVELATARGCRVALAAPTGRAAKRLEELGDAPAMTLHRLLGATPGRLQAVTVATAMGSAAVVVIPIPELVRSLVFGLAGVAFAAVAWPRLYKLHRSGEL